MYTSKNYQKKETTTENKPYNSRIYVMPSHYIDKDGEDSVAFSDATFKSLISASYDVCFGTFDGSRLNVIKTIMKKD